MSAPRPPLVPVLVAAALTLILAGRPGAPLARVEGAVRTAAPEGGDVTTVDVNPNVLPQTLAWSSNGRLAFLEAASNGTLRLVIANGTTLTRHALGHLESPPRTGGLAWSPDGTHLALTAIDNSNVSEIYTVAVDGTNLERLTQALDAIGPLSWTSP